MLHIYEVTTSHMQIVTTHIKNIRYRRYIIPGGCLEKSLPTEVPDEYAKDYIEARLILEDSPQASAALGRRSSTLYGKRPEFENGHWIEKLKR